MPMQFAGLTPPLAGESLDKTIHSAAWMAKLVQAATSRSFSDLTEGEAARGIELTTTGLTLPQCSVIGAIGATYPGSPTVEPDAYMAATLEVSEQIFYTKNAHVTSNLYVAAYPFLPGVPVRVRCSTPSTDVYTTGMDVGRATGDSTVSIRGTGLVLVSAPYTPDAGANYYCWVMLPVANGPIWAVNIGSLGPATHPLTGHTTGVAAILDNSSGNLVTTTKRRAFVRRDTTGTIADGTLIQLDSVSGRLTIVWADCAAHASLTGLAAVP